MATSRYTQPQSTARVATSSLKLRSQTNVSATNILKRGCCFAKGQIYHNPPYHRRSLSYVCLEVLCRQQTAQGAMGGTQGTMGRTRGWMGRRGEVSGAPAVFGGISVRGVLRVLENKIYIFEIQVFRSFLLAFYCIPLGGK